jgi:hypothetical protein
VQGHLVYETDHDSSLLRFARETAKASHRLASLKKFLLRSGHNVDHAATALGAELNSASRKSEQSVVLADAYVLAWVEVSSALTNDDLACVNFLTCVALYAETLCV